MVEFSDGRVNKPLTWQRLSENFYSGNDVLLLARQLIGMKLVTCTGDEISAGIITETEAYAGESDRASHAFAGRRTRRTETMYLNGGHAYIYLCYGIHSLFNVVTGKEGLPYAVLIRGIIPVEGYSVMRERIGREPDPVRDGTGPGKVTRLMGLNCSYDRVDLTEDRRIWIEQSAFSLSRSIISTTKRVGVDYAGEDALLPYRFVADHIAAFREIKMAGLV
jgi:DNA-3-methyladenine glycosylase